MTENFWTGKRALVTGHTGFKGGWLALWLRQLGAEVCGYALAPATEPSLFELAEVGRGMQSVFGDLDDRDSLEAVFSRFRPEIVFHLAAQPLVRASYLDPVATYRTNVLGTAHVLEAIRKTPGVRSVVVITSDKCYENHEWCWPYRETDALGGHDPYSSSKACAELVALAYGQSFFPSSLYSQHRVAIATARAGNVIGGGDWSPERLVPDAMRAFLERRPLVLRHPDAIRPWQHVLEPLSGYLLLAERLWKEGPTYGGAWNFGPPAHDAVSVSTLADELQRAWGANARWQHEPGDGKHEARTLQLDASKAELQLGWRPRWNFTRAVEETVGWYRSYAAGTDPRQLVLTQIDAYGAVSAGGAESPKSQAAAR